MDELATDEMRCLKGVQGNQEGPKQAPKGPREGPEDSMMDPEGPKEVPKMWHFRKQLMCHLSLGPKVVPKETMRHPKGPTEVPKGPMMDPQNLVAVEGSISRVHCHKKREPMEAPMAPREVPKRLLVGPGDGPGGFPWGPGGAQNGGGNHMLPCSRL